MRASALPRARCAARARASAAAEGAEGLPRRCRVAVIGAGAGGLAASKALLEDKHDIKVYEATNNVGGVWAYQPKAARLADARCGAEHNDGTATPMYRDLRTNLPREVMAYLSFPFASPYGDQRRYPTHAEVQSYLEAYAHAFDALPYIKLNTKVTSVAPSKRRRCAWDASLPAWDVATTCGTNGSTSVETFDAVVVANGHYSKPRMPDLSVEDGCQCLVVHSRDFDAADSHRDEFAGKRVVVVGTGASGVDIAIEVASVAAEVILCQRASRSKQGADGPTGKPLSLGCARGLRGNIFDAGAVPTRIASDGTLLFEDGSHLSPGNYSAEDVVVLLATGYHVDFPFLDDSASLAWEDNHVRPLIEHVFQDETAPTLSFIGLPWKCVPFPLMECQALWVSKLLAGDPAATSPSDAHATTCDDGRPAHHAHMMGDEQWLYNLRMLELAGVPPSAARDMHRPWRKALYDAAGSAKRADPERYRDLATFAPSVLGAAHAEASERRVGVSLASLARASCPASAPLGGAS